MFNKQDWDTLGDWAPPTDTDNTTLRGERERERGLAAGW